MNFTYLYSNNRAANNWPLVGKRFSLWLVFCLIAILSPVAWSEVLVSQVRGEVVIKLPSDGRPIKLYPGALLPDQIEIVSKSTDAQYWVLCPGFDKSQSVQPKEGFHQHCPKKESRKMRGADGESAPFILLPNQSSLEKLERILWSGPKDSEYSIMLFQYDIEGFEELIMEWLPEMGTYQESGIHEFVPTPPLLLAFTENKEVSYKLEIENIDTSQNSSMFDEILIKPITQAPSHDLMDKGYRLLGEQNIKRNSSLGKLILAAYLVGKGQRAEAYGLLSGLQNDRYRAQAQLLIAKALHQPGVPDVIIIKQYGKALEFAVADHDGLSSFIACRGIFSPSPLMLSSDGLEYQQYILHKPEFARYCRKL